jgi:hypothetical protein
MTAGSRRTEKGRATSLCRNAFGRDQGAEAVFFGADPERDEESLGFGGEIGMESKERMASRA